MSMDANSIACSDCARAVVCGDTLVCGLRGERCDTARNVWSATGCGPEGLCFTSAAPSPGTIVFVQTPRLDLIDRFGLIGRAVASLFRRRG